MSKQKHTMEKFDGRCCICRGPIAVEYGHWKLGHNADPIHVGHGRCCRLCNDGLVIPVRLASAFQRKINENFPGNSGGAGDVRSDPEG